MGDPDDGIGAIGHHAGNAANGVAAIAAAPVVPAGAIAALRGRIERDVERSGVEIIDNRLRNAPQRIAARAADIVRAARPANALRKGADVGDRAGGRRQANGCAAAPAGAAGAADTDAGGAARAA